MKTPQRVSLKEYADERNKFLKERCVLDGDVVRCLKCHTAIEILGAWISYHDARLGDICAGAGTVCRVAVPFCPKCEEVPDVRGCFHEMPIEEVGRG
jgi:hypothetical protein